MAGIVQRTTQAAKERTQKSGKDGYGVGNNIPADRNDDMTTRKVMVAIMMMMMNCNSSHNSNSSTDDDDVVQI